MVNKVTDGKAKQRLILDAKENGITECGRENERVILPTAIHLVFDTLHAHRESQNLQNIGLLVMDITDSFWTLVLRDSEKNEKNFFIDPLRGRYFVFSDTWRMARCTREACHARGKDCPTNGTRGHADWVAALRRQG